MAQEDITRGSKCDFQRVDQTINDNRSREMKERPEEKCKSEKSLSHHPPTEATQQSISI